MHVAKTTPTQEDKRFVSKIAVGILIIAPMTKEIAWHFNLPMPFVTLEKAELKMIKAPSKAKLKAIR